MGVFLEIQSLGLPAGTVVNLVFVVHLGKMVRLHHQSHGVKTPLRRRP